MALKAGYYGIKKAFKDAIESLIANTSDMLVIKSLDDALTLSDEGELSVDDASTSSKGIVQLDDEPTEDSENAITSGGVFAALQNAGSFTRDLLGSYDTAAVTNVLTEEDISGYDFLEIILSFPLGEASTDKAAGVSQFIAIGDLPEYVSDSNANLHILIMMWAGQGFSLAYDTANHALKSWGRNGSAFIYKVYGLKF